MNKKFFLYLGIIFSILYLIVGLYILLFGKNQFGEQVYIALGTVLVLYGGFRLYRIKKAWSKD
jgi:formate hydrogenlyase subunit 3/multisubunit Na+/H+ antiporter MnhD subunit